MHTQTNHIKDNPEKLENSGYRVAKSCISCISLNSLGECLVNKAKVDTFGVCGYYCRIENTSLE